MRIKGPEISLACTNMREKTGMSQSQFYSLSKAKAALPVKAVPEAEKWRLGQLSNLFKIISEI